MNSNRGNTVSANVHRVKKKKLAGIAFSAYVVHYL